MPKKLNVTIQSCNNGYIVTDDKGQQWIVTTISRDYTATSLAEVLRGIEDATMAYVPLTKPQE